MTKHDLQSASVARLEEIYRTAPPRPLRRACYRGTFLQRVDSDEARSARAGLVIAPFARLPFGVDFTRDCWFFLHPRFGMGRFSLAPGRSRWRETETLQMHYGVSRLPVRGLLYDEVKPLGDTLCLGFGGIRWQHGPGALFFFALESSPGDAAPGGVRQKKPTEDPP